jgi:hypothetical protein
VTTATVPMAAVAAVVGDSCDNSNDGSGVDGGGADGGCGDGECNSGNSGNGNGDGSGKATDDGGATKTTVATAMAVWGGGIYNNQLKRGQLKEQWQ